MDWGEAVMYLDDMASYVKTGVILLGLAVIVISTYKRNTSRHGHKKCISAK